MMHVERITPVVQLNLKLQCQHQVCNYSDAYLLVSWIITITGERWKKKVAAKQLDERNEGAIFKNCAPFTDCISEINNTQIDNANDLDVVMLIYNLIKYSYN